MKTRRTIAAAVAIVLVWVTWQAKDVVSEDALWPAVWPWLWATAIASCIVAAIRPTHLLAWYAAGTTLVVVSLARIPAVIANGNHGAYTPARAWYIVSTYVLIALLAAFTWLLAGRR